MNVNRLILGCLLLLILLIGGCTQQLNDRVMGRAIDRVMDRGTLSERVHDLDDKSLSVGLFDLQSKPRSHWSTLRYIAPMDEVVHGWTLTLWSPLKRTDKARVYGRFPSTDDVLRSNQGQGAAHSVGVWLNDVLFTIDELGRSFVGTPYAVGYLGLSGKLFDATTSPSRAWKRTDTRNTWSSGFPADQRTELDTEKQSLTKDAKHE